MDGAKTSMLVVAAVVANYWLISITMVVLNRYLLGGGDFPLDAPIFITWLQCVVAVISCGLLGACKRAFPGASFFERFHDFQADGTLMWRVLPLSLAFAGMITFNNLCLKYVGVAFYNVGRSLTTVFNVLLTFVMLGSAISWRVLSACTVIVLGFWLGVDQEGDSSAQATEGGGTLLLGVLFGALSSFCVAINAVLTQTTVRDIKDNWLLTYYNNLNAVFILLPVILLLGEHREIAAHVDLVMSVRFWLLNAVAGFFGIAIGLATMLQIKYTSPLTHNVSGTAKSSVQTAGAVFYAGTQKSGLWWLSNAIVLAGSFGYAWVKHDEMQQAERDRSPTVIPLTTKN